jgi:hypothetical protein
VVIEGREISRKVTRKKKEEDGLKTRNWVDRGVYMSTEA